MMRMQMMRKLRCLAWFPCLLAFLLLPGSVHAKEYACDVTIPATVQVSGDRIPSGEVYEVVMEAITKDAPVAENMTQKVLNSGTVSFGQIHYTVPGDHQYKIYQKSGSTDRFTYDKTVYTVTVRVQNDAEGGLFAELWAAKEYNGNPAATGCNWGTAYRRCAAASSVGCTDPALFEWKHDNCWKNEKM